MPIYCFAIAIVNGYFNRCELTERKVMESVSVSGDGNVIFIGTSKLNNTLKLSRI